MGNTIWIIPNHLSLLFLAHDTVAPNLPVPLPSSPSLHPPHSRCRQHQPLPSHRRTVDSSALLPGIMVLAGAILILNVIHVLLEAGNDQGGEKCLY